MIWKEELTKGEGRECEESESYKVLDRSPDHRIGIGDRISDENIPRSFLEVTVVLFPGGTAIDLALLEKKLRLLKELERRGYALYYHDDACISAEVYLPADKLLTEYGEVAAELKDVLAGHYK